MRRMGFVVVISLLALSLLACTGQEQGALSAEDEAKAQQLLQAYDRARLDGNWEAALVQGERLRSKYPDSPAARTLRASYDDTLTKADAAVEKRRLGALWTYQSLAVEGGRQYTAQIDSRVEANPDDDTTPAPDARLVLRIHPDWGHSSYLLLNQKQFECGTPCTMQIKFDEAALQTFAGKQADSGQGPALFIEDQQAFHAAMSQAKIVRIVLPKTGSYTPPTLVFEVAGYDRSQLGAQF